MYIFRIFFSLLNCMCVLLLKNPIHGCVPYCELNCIKMMDHYSFLSYEPFITVHLSYNSKHLPIR